MIRNVETGNEMILKIPDAFAPVIFRLKAFLMFQDESHNEINDDRRAEGKKREVNKIHPDVRCLDAKLFAPPLTNTEGLLFKPVYNFTYHFYKYRKFVCCLFFYREALSKNSATLQRRQAFFEQKLSYSSVWAWLSSALEAFLPRPANTFVFLLASASSAPSSPMA